MNLTYYTEQSSRSAVSAAFAAKFGATPKEIIAQVRRMMIHPCENPNNFSDANWPAWHTAAALENEFKSHSIVAGHCGHYTKLAVAIMRAKNIPARSRCGFAIYFKSDFYDDHWAVEYWDNNDWKLADGQKNRMDYRPGQFINGAIAWQLVRKYGFAPELFGFSEDTRGIYYVAANLIRDASGLAKHELDYDEECELIKKTHALTEAENIMLDDVSKMIFDEDIAGLEKTLGGLYPKLF